ncbi:UNVERIFIED_CONTAM: hypothetical protein Sradi_3179700 [Sesamum radiatum]|uniref:Uncharacterized protein n=1 Tax=Sesamum radiatum TaxID=300843 RepID=A0AAW2REW4_SESRA
MNKLLEWQFPDQKLSGLLVLSRRAIVPGRKRWGFVTSPVAGTNFLAVSVTGCFRGAAYHRWTCKRFALSSHF